MRLSLSVFLGLVWQISPLGANAEDSNSASLWEQYQAIGTCNDPRLRDEPGLKLLLCGSISDWNEAIDEQKKREVYLKSLEENWESQFRHLSDTAASE